MKYITLLLLISQISYANQAIIVKTGDVVSPQFNNGTLADNEKAQQIRDELIEKDGLEKQVQSYEKSIKLYKENESIYIEQKDMLLKQNIELTKTLNQTRETSDLVKVGYFVLGVTVTGLAVYGASKLAK